MQAALVLLLAWFLVFAAAAEVSCRNSVPVTKESIIWDAQLAAIMIIIAAAVVAVLWVWMELSKPRITTT